jgi:hypothetical protein
MLKTVAMYLTLKSKIKKFSVTHFCAYDQYNKTESTYA